MNDGCPAVAPSLQQLDGVLDRLLTDIIGQGLGVTLDESDVVASVDYDAANDDLSFNVDFSGFDATTQVPLVASLPDAGGGALPELVSLFDASSSGVVDLTLSGDANIAFGIELADATPYVLGSTGLHLTAFATAAEPGLAFEAGVGPITVGVGETAVDGESDADCDDADANTDQADSDGDGFVNDGCGAVGDAEAGADCAYGESSDSDGDGAVNDGCPARSDGARLHLGGTIDVDVDGADTAKSYLPGSSSPAIGFSADLGGTPQPECENISISGFTGDKHACAVLPLYLGDEPLPDNGSDHHVQILAELSSTPEVAAAYAGADQLFDAIAGSVIDLLLLESGIGPLVDQLVTLLSDSLLSVDLPVIGDALDLVLGIAESLQDGLQGAVTDTLSGGDPLESLDPLNANAAEVAALVQTAVADPLSDALASAGILLDQDQTARVAIGGGDPGGVRAVTICDDGPCDTGAENDPSNPALAGDPDVSDNCEGNEDEDGDGVPNDGCPAVPNTEAPDDCDGVDSDGDGLVDDGCPAIPADGDPELACDGVDDASDGEGPDGTVDDGCTWDPAGPAEEADTEANCENGVDDDFDGAVNDGCDPVFDSASDVTDIAFSFRIGQAADADLASLDGSIGFDAGIDGLGLSLETDGVALQALAGWDLDLVIGVSKDHGFYLVTDEAALLGGDGDGTANEINADATIVVSDPDGAPATLTGTFAFLQATATDGLESYPVDGASTPEVPSEPPPGVPAGRSFIGVEANADVLDPGPVFDSRLTAGELVSGPSFGDLLSYDFGGRAEVHLGLSVGIDEDLGEGLPQLVTGMHLVWDWNVLASGDPDSLEPSGGPSSELTMWMDRMYMDAGSFVSDFLAPVFEDIQTFTKAFQPIIDVINEPIPVLSDFAGEPVTMLTLGKTLAAAYDIDLTLL
ncbi:MAG: hypothetical protein OSA99_20110, partial [Acidimicrobiales bacterium]|nr:hypothetical protein [Acidimicrobiales bacterium]